MPVWLKLRSYRSHRLITATAENRENSEAHFRKIDYFFAPTVMMSLGLAVILLSILSRTSAEMCSAEFVQACCEEREQYDCSFPGLEDMIPGRHKNTTGALNSISIYV